MVGATENRKALGGRPDGEETRAVGQVILSPQPPRLPQLLGPQSWTCGWVGGLGLRCRSSHTCLRTSQGAASLRAGCYLANGKALGMKNEAEFSSVFLSSAHHLSIYQFVTSPTVCPSVWGWGAESVVETGSGLCMLCSLGSGNLDHSGCNLTDFTHYLKLTSHELWAKCPCK